MKKIILKTFGLAGLLACLPQHMQAAKMEDDLLQKFSTTVNSTPDAKKVVCIPADIFTGKFSVFSYEGNACRVAVIGAWALANCKGMKNFDTSKCKVNAENKLNEIKAADKPAAPVAASSSAAAPATGVAGAKVVAPVPSSAGATNPALALSQEIYKLSPANKALVCRNAVNGGPALVAACAYDPTPIVQPGLAKQMPAIPAH